jgi:hypothetical protein
MLATKRVIAGERDDFLLNRVDPPASTSFGRAHGILCVFRGLLCEKIVGEKPRQKVLQSGVFGTSFGKRKTVDPA